LHTKLNATSDWKRSGWTNEAMVTTAARMQRGAESSKAKGRSDWRECESVTTARGVNPFTRKTLPLAPISPDVHQSNPTSDTGGPGPQVIQLVCGSPSAEKANRHERSEPPPAVVRLSISAGNNGPVSDTGAQAHESYSLGVGF
jgi:hypothetical protein